MIGFVSRAIGVVPAPLNDVPSVAGRAHGVLRALLKKSPVLSSSIELKITPVAAAGVAGKVKLRRGCRGAGGTRRRRRKLAAAGIKGAGGVTRRGSLIMTISTCKG